MVARKPKAETKLESYRARARVTLTIKGIEIPRGQVFTTDAVPFDEKTMERA